MRQILMKVARWIQSRGEVRSISERDLLRLLNQEETPGWRDWTTVEKIAVDLGAHSGLLTMQAGRYQFVHLGFQEFLSARSIAFDEDPQATLAPHVGDGAWREVILLTTGFLFEIGNLRLGKSLVEGLLQNGPGSHCHRLALAVEAAAQAPDSGLGRLKKDLVTESVAIIQDKTNHDDEQDRFALGQALGYLGDPRLGLTRQENWIAVGTQCRFARFPVTNEDFKPFIEAGGYTNLDYWDEEGRAWLAKELPDPANRFPRYWWNKDWNVPNQPVVGVSWHEARAFCRWLTVKGQGADWLAEGWEVRLPDGEQWGLAAGEGKREFPWGNQEPDPTRANYDARLEKTSPVGLYPNGEADGIQDLAGNVWEWPLENDDDGFLILRGGACYFPSLYLASSYRFRNWAGYRHQDFGFRCCLAPRAVL